MIDEVFRFLRDRLNAALPRDAGGGAAEDLFVFAGGGGDSPGLKTDAVSMLLVNIEQETTLRNPDPYARVDAAGLRLRVEPEIRLNLSLLFAARFPDNYALALKHISSVIRYFQGHRVFNTENAPDLKADVATLILELVTPSFAEQNSIWGALRTSYLPSALYKVRMIVFQDEAGRALPRVEQSLLTVAKVPPR